MFGQLLAGASHGTVVDDLVVLEILSCVTEAPSELARSRRDSQMLTEFLDVQIQCQNHVKPRWQNVVEVWSANRNKPAQQKSWVKGIVCNSMSGTCS